MSDVTQILSDIDRGDPRAAEELLPLVYEELRQLAAVHLANEKPGQTLQATALVHEAYLRLVGARSASKGADQPLACAAGSQTFANRAHFFAAAAEAMRRILIDAARRKQTRKAGGGLRRLNLDDVDPVLDEDYGDELVALDDAIKLLEAKDPRKAALVKLRFFAGLTAEQAAAVLNVSISTAEKDWTYARSWLRVAIDRAAAG